MKIVRIMLVFAFVSMLSVSCKETKKEEVKDDAAVEMTDDAVESEEAVTSEADASTTSESDNAEAAATGAAAGAASKAAAEGIDASSKDLESFEVPEGVLAEELADTPVIYPGCSGSAEEIRVCNRESFIAFIKREFNAGLAAKLELDEGAYEIKSIIHVDGAGKISTLKVVAPHHSLESEMKRVIGAAPTVVPATENGEPVEISFLLPVKFKVEI